VNRLRSVIRGGRRTGSEADAPWRSGPPPGSPRHAPIQRRGSPPASARRASKVAHGKPSERGTIAATGGAVLTVWFTLKLDDRPGSLARVAAALGDRGVNITRIVGVAEDTDGALMLTTSDPAATREAFAGLSLA